MSLYPTYQQLTRVSPFPGTPLWERLREEGRVADVPWEDVHFWSGAQKNIALEPHETLNLTERGYDLLYRTWGPSILRRFDVQMNGYQYCCKSPSAVMRRHKAKYFKRQCAMLWTSIYAMDRFAPNGVVRRRVRKLDERYRALLGEPTPVMEALGRSMDRLVTLFKVQSFFDPLNRHPKEEPFKRYIYDKSGKDGSSNGSSNGGNGGATPYRLEMGKPTKEARAELRKSEITRVILSATLKAVRFGRRHAGDPIIDDYLIHRMSLGRVGFGF